MTKNEKGACSRRTAVCVGVLWWFATSGIQAQECLLGAWEGTLGKSTVTFEFINTYDDEGMGGRYYYGNRLTDLLLKWSDENAGWQEIDPRGKTTGAMSLDCAGDSLSGTWRNPDGKGAQSVTARRIEPTRFAQRRLAAVAPQRGPPQHFEGHRYVVLSVPEVSDVSTIEVLDESDGGAAINAKLRRDFLENLEQAQSCAAYGRLARGDKAGFAHEASSELLAWNREFLVIRQSSGGFCGGAHPYHSNPVHVFAIRDGSFESMATWLLPEYAKGVKADTALGRVLMEGYKKARDAGEDLQECVDAVSFDTNLWPTSDGMVFATDSSYAAQACNEEIRVRYPEMQPFLSAYGREHAKVFSDMGHGGG